MAFNVTARSGKEFGRGLKITNDTTIELSPSSNPASDYSVVNIPDIGAREQSGSRSHQQQEQPMKKFVDRPQPNVMVQINREEIQ
jgi:hypothetical protein